MELAPSRELNSAPLHPYSVALLSAIPVPNPAIEATRRRIILTGDVPSPVNPPSGCRFHTRCWLRERLGRPERCTSEEPALRELASGHTVACHFAEDVAGSVEQVQALGARRGRSSGGPVPAGTTEAGTSPAIPPTAPPPGAAPTV
jgi:oligopeptide/dipeptide ABC transporter ATP-binding protein